VIGLVKIKKKGIGNHVKINILLGNIYYPCGKTHNLYKQDGILVPLFKIKSNQFKTFIFQKLIL
jgi:hypothetical protein